MLAQWAEVTELLKCAADLAARGTLFPLALAASRLGSEDSVVEVAERLFRAAWIPRLSARRATALLEAALRVESASLRALQIGMLRRRIHFASATREMPKRAAPCVKPQLRSATRRRVSSASPVSVGGAASRIRR